MPESPRFRDFAVFLLLLVLPAVLCASALLANAIPDFMDPVVYFFPLRYHAAQLVHQGELPLWNRCLMFGAPLFANPQAALAYPLNWPMLLVPSGVGYTAPLLLELGLFGGATYLLLRRLGAHAGACVFAALLCLGGSYGWTRLQFGNFMNILPWWPCWLWAGIAFAQRPRATSLAGGAFSVAMMLLGGAHQLAVYGALGLFPLFMALLAGGPARRRWLGFTFATGLMGVLISAPGWLPQWAFLKETLRSANLDRDTVLVGAVATPGELLRSFAIPLRDAGMSVGLGSFALMISAVIPRDRRFAVFWMGAWIGIVLTAGLAWRPIAAFAFDFIPGFGAFHDPKRVLGITNWLLCLATGLSAAGLLSDNPEESTVKRFGQIVPGLIMGGILLWTCQDSLFLWTMAGLAAAGLLLLTFALYARPAIGRSAASAERAATGGWEALYKVLCVFLLVFGASVPAYLTWTTVDMNWLPVRNLLGSEPPPLLKDAGLSPGERFFAMDWKRDYSYDFQRLGLRDSALPNLGMLWGFEDAGGYEPARSSRYDRWLDAASPWPGQHPPWRGAFGLLYPPFPGSEAARRFGEGNIRAVILPEWGIPAYLIQIEPDRLVGPLPNWMGSYEIRMLQLGGAKGPSEQEVGFYSGALQVSRTRLDPATAVPASAIKLTSERASTAGGAIELAPDLVIQTVGVSNPDGLPISGFDVRIPESGQPVWAFLWSPDLEADYRPKAGDGSRTLCALGFSEGWATIEGGEDESVNGEVSSESIRSSRLELNAYWPGKRPARLVIHDAYWPGWMAWVNGKAVAIEPSGPDKSGLWRTLEIPPGASRVVLAYVPPQLELATGLSILGLLALLTLGWILDRHLLNSGPHLS